MVRAARRTEGQQVGRGRERGRPIHAAGRWLQRTHSSGWAVFIRTRERPRTSVRRRRGASTGPLVDWLWSNSRMGRSPAYPPAPTRAACGVRPLGAREAGSAARRRPRTGPDAEMLLNALGVLGVGVACALVQHTTRLACGHNAPAALRGAALACGMAGEGGCGAVPTAGPSPARHSRPLRGRSGPDGSTHRSCAQRSRSGRAAGPQGWAAGAGCATGSS